MSTVLSSPGSTFRHNLRSALTIADFKTKWLQDRLKELKDERGISGAAVGERMGVTRSRISQVKNGRPVDDDFVQRFCDAFGFKFPVNASTDAVNIEKGPTSADIMAAIARIEQSVTALLNAQVMMMARMEQREKEKGR